MQKLNYVFLIEVTAAFTIFLTKEINRFLETLSSFCIFIFVPRIGPRIG